MKPKDSDIIAALHEDRTRLTAELAAANRRIEQMDDILARKNIAIRLLALGDMGTDATITAALVSDEHTLSSVASSP